MEKEDKILEINFCPSSSSAMTSFSIKYKDIPKIIKVLNKFIDKLDIDKNKDEQSKN